MKIGYQGISGAYSEEAGEQFIKLNKIKDATLIGFEDFEIIFKQVENNELNYGVIPVENSLAGSIYKNFDLLGQYHLKVVGEIYIHVNHQLMAIKSAKKNDIKEIYSHYQALAQCAHNISVFYKDSKVIEYFDTAGSAQFIKNENDKSKACLASAKAGKINGLKILNKNFQDDKNNYTRFLIISKNYLNLKETQNKSIFKTSLIFKGANVPLFLFKALGCFSLRDINLLKIESRPIPKSPWSYYFYLDFKGKFDDENVKNAINNLKEISEDVKVLGSFKSSKI